MYESIPKYKRKNFLKFQELSMMEANYQANSRLRIRSIIKSGDCLLRDFPLFLKKKQEICFAN
jgi:hypothetical protein